MLIASKNIMFREGIGAILRQDPCVQIVGEAGNLEEVVDKAERLRPQIVLLDAVLTDGSTLEAIRRMRKSYEGIGILVLNISGRLKSATQLLQAGASVYVSPETRIEQLMDLIRATSTSASGTKEPSYNSRLVRSRRAVRKPRKPPIGFSMARQKGESSRVSLPKVSQAAILRAREGRSR